jgi:ABC-2 type transport system ATP-binding protein
VTPAVVATGLVKEFEKGRHTVWQRLRGKPDQRTRFRAVDGIDLRVETGEIFGLLGPNGAGKTTTMKMLSTLLEPTSGTIEVLGIDVARRPREVRARLGAMLSGERSLYWKLTARENLEYFAALYHVPPTGMKERIEKALAAVKLSDRADDYVERYSTGMRQRLALARALLPDPPLVILDEPTVGLDPQSARDLRDRVRDLRAQGRTVLLTTHYMEEADQLCDRVAIIDHGRIVDIGSPAALVRRHCPERSVIVVTEDAAALERFQAMPQVDAVSSDGPRLTIRGRGDDLVTHVIHCLGEHRIRVIDFRTELPTLEDVFLKLTGHQIRD